MPTTPKGIWYPGPSEPFPPGFSGEGGFFQQLAESVDALVDVSMGLVAIGTFTSSLTGITTETTVITIPDVSLEADRRYVLRGHCRTSSDSGSGDSAQMTCYFVDAASSSRVLARDVTIGSGSGGWSTLAGESNVPYVPASDETRNITLTIQGSGNPIRLNASGAAPAVLKVFDVGPA